MRDGLQYGILRPGRRASHTSSAQRTASSNPSVATPRKGLARGRNAVETLRGRALMGMSGSSPSPVSVPMLLTASALVFLFGMRNNFIIGR